MSKIGQKPLKVPESVQLEIQEGKVEVKGVKGQMTLAIPPYMSVEKDENGIVYVKRESDTKKQKSVHGFYRKLLENAVKGVNDLWNKKLEIQGTGFNVKMQGQSIVMKLGLSHQVNYQPPEGIQLATEENNIIIVSGIDRQLVGEIAHQIKSIKKPDPYKGKGIRYQGEHIKLKPGKKAKTA